MYSFSANQAKRHYGFGPNCIAPIASNMTAMHHVSGISATIVFAPAPVAGAPKFMDALRNFSIKPVKNHPPPIKTCPTTP